jgi:hypothetical protein
VKGQAPEKLIASRSSSGALEQLRPLFLYPVLARLPGDVVVFRESALAT